MRIKPLVFLFFILPEISLYGQNCDAIFKSALSAYSKNDTASFLKYLEKYSQACPDSPLIKTAYLFQATVFEWKGDNGKAIQLIQTGLSLPDQWENPMKFKKYQNEVYELLGEPDVISNYKLIKQISNLYQAEKDYVSAIKYLDQINRNRLPGYSGCVNGMIGIESRIAMTYADCYLSMGDTLNAINRLVDYALFQEPEISEKVAQKLKPLLVQHYTQQAIRVEVEKSVDNVRVYKETSASGYTFEHVEFVFFGRKIPFMYGDLQGFKEFIAYNRNLAYLKE